MTKKTKLSIIIVEFNSERYLFDCLDSIQNNLENDFAYEVLVINNKPDNKIERKRFQKYEHVRYFETQKNLGFGGANNFGVREALGEYLLLLNPDTLVLPQSIQSLLSFMQSHDEFGLIGLRLLSEINGDEERDYYGDFPTLKSLISRNNQRKNKDLGEIIVTERISGACMMIKKEIFEKVGGFDTDFFMYFEDTDLCKRIMCLGLKIAVLKNAKIIHFGGKTQTSSKQKKLYYYKSQDRFFKKHYGLWATLAMKVARWPMKYLKTR